MKKTYYSLIMLLIGVLLLSMFFAGCGQEVKIEYRDVEVEKIVEIEKEMVTKEITWMMRDSGNKGNTDLKIYDWLREAGNLIINPVMVPIDVYMDRLSILVAGNNLSDITNIGQRDIFIPSVSPDFSLAQEIGPKGMLVNLTENIDKLPHYAGWLSKFSQYAGGITASDGNIYFASVIRNYNPTSSLGGVIRADLADTMEWESFDELLNTLKYMRDNSTGYIWTNRNGILDLNLLSYSFGTSLIEFPYYDQYKGKFVNTIETENFKDAVIFFKTLVDEDILTPEWASYPEPQWYGDAGNGDCQFWVDNMMNAPTHNFLMEQNGIKGEFEAFIPPAYNGIFYGWAGKSRLSKTGSIISSSTDALDNILAMLDWTYDDSNSDKLYWGDEGITYRRNSAGEPRTLRDGIAKDEAFVKLRTDIYGIGADSNVIKVYGNAAYYNDIGQDCARKWEPYGKVYGDNVYTYSVPAVPLTEDEAEFRKVCYTPLQTYIQENVTNFINGNKPMSEFDAFVAKVKDMGADDLVAIYNEAITR